MQIDYNSPEYKKSRLAYMAQCTFEYFVSLLVADAFLAKLLTSVGISDSLAGIISSFISIAFVFQIFSIFLVKSNMSSKKMVIICETVSMLFFMLIYLVPFIPVSAEMKKLVVVVSALAAYIIKYLIQSVLFKWANAYVEPRHRARYSANKEMTSLVLGIAFTMTVSYIIDKFESIGNLNGGFLLIAVTMLVINILNFISLMLIKKENSAEHEAEKMPLREVVRNTFGNKNFRNVIIMTCMWEFARYFSIGFMGVFKTNDLMMTLFTVQVINMVANGLRIAFSRPFGEYSDKTSFARGMELAIYVAAAGFFINIFTTPGTWYFIIFYTVLYSVSLAGTNQNSFNITYSYVPLECITQATAVKNMLGGLCGFAASLFGGKLLDAVQTGGNTLFGIPVYGQQVLSLISFVITVLTAVFIRFVIAKQKVKIQ